MNNQTKQAVAWHEYVFYSLSSDGIKLVPIRVTSPKSAQKPLRIGKTARDKERKQRKKQLHKGAQYGFGKR